MWQYGGEVERRKERRKERNDDDDYDRCESGFAEHVDVFCGCDYDYDYCYC